MLRNRSVAAISSPEFINLVPYNPLISTCEIKVFYLGQNRNGSYIDKETAIQMANSLPGTPIVGAYRTEIEDFGDHGKVAKIEDGEITFACKTRPYGFVAPDAQVWFQKFIDTDEFGNEIEREYLMTTGYLWTGQYPEIQAVTDEGQPQSMELDEDTLEGHWATDNNSGLEFFIINDAVFSKLCVLGSDVEPCFEGASITSPEVSKNFGKDPEFAQTLFTMMNELKDALRNEGGSKMPNEQVEEYAEAVEEQEELPQADVEVPADEGNSDTIDFDTNDDDDDSEESDDSDSVAGAPIVPENDEEDYVPDGTIGLEEDEPIAPGSDEDDVKKKQQYELLLEQYHLLEEENLQLKAENQELQTFKLEVENQKKDALINKYYMLTDEDKADVINNKLDYSLDEIEQKLALIYVRKTVDFNSINNTDEESDDNIITTFSIQEESAEYVSPIQESLRRTIH